jgi:hypothetical protein
MWTLESLERGMLRSLGLSASMMGTCFEQDALFQSRMPCFLAGRLAQDQEQPVLDSKSSGLSAHHCTADYLPSLVVTMS